MLAICQLVCLFPFLSFFLFFSLSLSSLPLKRKQKQDYLPSQEPFDVVFVSPLARFNSSPLLSLSLFLFSCQKYFKISPLSFKRRKNNRALETGLLIFQHQPPPKMIVNFDLVEFNEHQTYNDTKYFRHIGHSRQYLREKLLQSYLNGDPFSGGLNGESERLVQVLLFYCFIVLYFFIDFFTFFFFFTLQLFDKLEWMDDRGNSEKDWIPVSDFQSDAKSVSCIRFYILEFSNNLNEKQKVFFVFLPFQLPLIMFLSNFPSHTNNSRLTRFLKMLWEKYLIPDLRVCIGRNFFLSFVFCLFQKLIENKSLSSRSRKCLSSSCWTLGNRKHQTNSNDNNRPSIKFFVLWSLF